MKIAYRFSKNWHIILSASTHIIRKWCTWFKVEFFYLKVLGFNSHLILIFFFLVVHPCFSNVEFLAPYKKFLSFVLLGWNAYQAVKNYSRLFLNQVHYSRVMFICDSDPNHPNPLMDLVIGRILTLPNTPFIVLIDLTRPDSSPLLRVKNPKFASGSP